jgi:hypothetical protein
VSLINEKTGPVKPAGKPNAGNFCCATKL